MVRNILRATPLATLLLLSTPVAARAGSYHV